MPAEERLEMPIARHVKNNRGTSLWGLFCLLLVTGLVLIAAANMRKERSEQIRMQAVESGAESQVPGERNGQPTRENPQKEVEPDRRPSLVLIIDDIGFSLSAARELAEMRIPLTWSIIPYQSHSLSSLKLAKERGIPVMLHLPMEAEVDRPGLKYQINLEMDEASIRSFVKRAVMSLPGVIGVNNHRGSRATSTPRVMEAVLGEIRAQGLIFVDSRTSGKSVAFRMASQMNIPTLKNEVFLDHEADANAMRRALERAFSIARKQGSVVVIGHARPETLRFLKTLSGSKPEDVKWMTVPEAIRRSPGSSQGGMTQ